LDCCSRGRRAQLDGTASASSRTGFGFDAPARTPKDQLTKGDAVAKGFVHTVYKNETWINELEDGNQLPGMYDTKERAVPDA
jgi:hypothetical protein